LDISMAFNSGAGDTSAIDGKRFFVPANGPQEVILSSNNMLIE